ncbi:hypothetical protein E3N88_25723 [Mikania micrantha]|uniref:Uncharacterized protein n=1 Tax=Mikania micrantha TaxID=192012 RepID=A0A5N6N5Q1_9ASTR|nr:hypothetical protein E3N88_25723 [Mikania micrantha]
MDIQMIGAHPKTPNLTLGPSAPKAFLVQKRKDQPRGGGGGGGKQGYFKPLQAFKDSGRLAATHDNRKKKEVHNLSSSVDPLTDNDNLFWDGFDSGSTCLMKGSPPVTMLPSLNVDVPSAPYVPPWDEASQDLYSDVSTCCILALCFSTPSKKLEVGSLTDVSILDGLYSH